MISVQEVIVDPDMIAPQPFTILRSTGKFVPGGFDSTTTSIPVFGPVQQASDREIQMLPEADRVSSIRSFWSTQPMYETRGYAPVPGVHGEQPVGSGVTYTLSSPPPNGLLQVYSNGLLLRPGVHYLLNGLVLTFATTAALPLYVTWPATVNVGTNASDLIQYASEQYRVLKVYFDPGGGYYKALGTSTAAA